MSLFLLLVMCCAAIAVWLLARVVRQSRAYRATVSAFARIVAIASLTGALAACSTPERCAAAHGAHLACAVVTRIADQACAGGEVTIGVAADDPGEGLSDAERAEALEQLERAADALRAAED